MKERVQVDCYDCYYASCDLVDFKWSYRHHRARPELPMLGGHFQVVFLKVLGAVSTTVDPLGWSCQLISHVAHARVDNSNLSALLTQILETPLGVCV